MLSAWFAGPKAENAPWFNAWIARIADDYAAWRRNYFPEDGVVVDSSLRRHNEPFVDAFEDRVLELLARLKGDVPFHSPRYAAHMVAEQSLPGIAGYFAAMLYNPNNVSNDSAPVTVKLELEAGRMLCRMIGYGEDSWAHLCSGGTSANIEALWAARSVKYLPFVVRDACLAASIAQGEALADDRTMLGLSPSAAMESYASMWRAVRAAPDAPRLSAIVRDAVASSVFNVVERGVGAVCARLGSSPALLVPESHHYCFEKALDVLGLGRRAIVSVRVDENFRMRPDELARALDDLDRSGRHALAVVAVVGSTEEGSVDPVDKIVALREARERGGRPSFWLHADGAYGGYLRTVTIPTRIGLGEPRASVKIGGRIREVRLSLPEHGECDALEAMRHCDSVTIDPHKLGYIPYPAGAICFRSDLVKPLLRQTAPYLEDAPGDPDAERRAESVGLYVLEGSKPGATAAAVWLSHSLIPLDTSGHGRLIREDIRNACELHALLEGHNALAGEDAPRVRAVCLCPPGSNIVCYAFRPARESAPLEGLNRLNRAIYERFSLRAGERVYEQSFFVSRTMLSLKQYSLATVGGFLDRLGVRPEEYERQGVFLLRSVLMNPWYAQAKARGRYFLSELVGELHRAAGDLASA
jgi:glutamate/tyrosine decarboxylase-like PLP-dependent enzyme